LPRRELPPAPARHLGHEMIEGVRWMWQHRYIRATALCVVGLNLFFAAYFLVIIVAARQRGVPAGEIGIMAAMFGAGGLLGVLGVAGGIAAAAGPAMGGALLEVLQDNQVILLCAAGIAILTLSITISPTMRSFPRAPALDAVVPALSSPSEKGKSDG